MKECKILSSSLVLSEEYTFDSYVASENNVYAYNIAWAVARTPRVNTIYNR